MRLEIDADAIGVADDLLHLLVQREHQAWLAAPRSLGDVLQAHDALADARDPGDDRRAADEVAAVHHRIEAGSAGGHAGRGIEGGGVLAARPAGGLHPPVDLDALTIDDPERVPAHLKVVPARLDDLDRPHRGAEPLFHSQPDDRVGNRFFGQRDLTVPVDRTRFDREHGGEVLPLQRFGEDVKGVATLHTAGGAGGARHAVHVDAAGADLRRRLEEQTVGLLQLLPEYLACREDDFELALRLERAEIPPETRRIANEPVGGDFEQDDDAGFVELGGAAIDELDAHRRLAGADAAFQENDIAPRNPRCEDDIEPADSCLDEIEFSHLPADLEVVPPDHVVAFTGGLLQPLSICHGDTTTVHLENPGLLEDGHRDADHRPARAQQLCEEFLRDEELVAIDAVGGGQNPARATLLQSVKSVARRRAHRGNQQGMRVFREHVSKGPVLLEFPVEVLDGELQRRAFVNGDRFAWHAARADTRRNPRCAFAADCRGPDAVAVRHQRQETENRILRKVNVIERCIRLVDDLLRPELDSREVSRDLREVGRFQGGEQLIGGLGDRRRCHGVVAAAPERC